MRDLEFVTVDVFTDRQFGGNPLAVVLNGEGLSSATMQAIAAEFNLSETTFVLPPKQKGNTAEVRIFVPKAELPFAGHPNIGTAFALARAGTVYGEPVDPEGLVFEEKAGLVRLELARSDGEVTGARLTAPETLSVGESFSADLIAAACSVDADDLSSDRHEPCIASCGTRFVLAEVKTLAALAKASPDRRGFAGLFPGGDFTGVLLYVRDPGGQVDIRARMFAPLKGVQEDPATGSANVALVGLLAKLDPADDLDLVLKIAQGVEMGRPSLMVASAAKRSDLVEETTIGGSCVAVMAGTIRLL